MGGALVKTIKLFGGEVSVNTEVKSESEIESKREMSILEKIKNEPGLTADEILNKFSEWERNEIYPPLNPINVRLMLDELAEVDYIELRDEKA